MEETKNETAAPAIGERAAKKMNASDVLMGVVAVLIIMSGIQVFQMQGLLSAISSGAIKASAHTQGSATGLQSQVGGC